MVEGRRWDRVFSAFNEHSALAEKDPSGVGLRTINEAGRYLFCVLMSKVDLRGES